MKPYITTLILLFLFIISGTSQNKKPYIAKENNKIKAIYYYDTGEIYQTGYYTLSGKLDGKWISYDKTGKKIVQGFYNNGKRTGTWEFFSKNEKKEVSYDNSAITKIKTWKNTETQIVSNK